MLFNTSIGLASAKTCLHDAQLGSQISEIDDSQNMMPCHQAEQSQEVSQQNNQHCDGLCLCLFVAVAPTFFSTIDDDVSFQLRAQQIILNADEALVSISQTPATHPPKYHS